MCGGRDASPRTAVHIIHLCFAGVVVASDRYICGEMGRGGDGTGELCAHPCRLSTAPSPGEQPPWPPAQHRLPNPPPATNSLPWHVCHHTSLLLTPPYTWKGTTGGPVPPSCCALSIPFLTPHRPSEKKGSQPRLRLKLRQAGWDELQCGLRVECPTNCISNSLCRRFHEKAAQLNKSSPTLTGL